MHVFFPSKNFIQVSVTGEKCDLMCPHCQGRFLKHMAAAESPEELWDLALEEKARGTKGMLISGGSDKNGAVPILPYLDIIKNIKEELNLSINLHTGLIALEDIPKLSGKGIDAVSFDIVGSAEALRNVYGMEIEPDYHDKALAEFKRHGLKAVPHITVGLDRGGDSGEENSLRTIARHEPDFVVINALMSSEGEKKAAERLPVILKLARDILPEKTAMGIGCMRPRGDLLSAKLIRELGIESIALPPKGLVEELKNCCVEIEERDGCCALYGD